MSIRDEVKRRALELLGDPRILELLQNEHVLRLLGALTQVPSRLNSITKEQAERVARTFRLATAEEVEELRATVDRMSRQLDLLTSRLEKSGMRKIP